MMPSCSHTGTPIHFHSSITSASASLIRARSRPSMSPRQSPSSRMRASIIFDGDSADLLLLFALAVMVTSTARLDHLPAIAGRIAKARIHGAIAIHRLLRELYALGAQLLAGAAAILD